MPDVHGGGTLNQDDVLDAIRDCGPVTVREVCVLLGSEDHQNIGKKVTQLVRWGLIERCGVAQYGRGQTATLYRVTSRGASS